jgi:hypothetical protein
MSKKQLPAKQEPEDNERFCSYIFPEDDSRAGKRCTAFRMTDSHLCFMHSDESNKLYDQISRKAARQKKLREELEFDYHELQTEEGIASFLEKVCNGVMAGYIKRDKAGIIAMFVPQLVKIAKSRKSDPKALGGRQVGIQINIGNPDTNKIAAGFTPEQLDRFIMGGEAVAIQMIDDMQATGKVKVTPRKHSKHSDQDVIEIEAKEPERPEDLPVPVAEIAEMTKLKPAIVEDIFGEFLGDTEGAGAAPIVNPDDFAHLWTKKGVPLELQGRCHRFSAYPKVKAISEKQGIYVWTCEWCGFETNNQKNKGNCPKARYDKEYAELEARDRDEAVLGTEEKDIFD